MVRRPSSSPRQSLRTRTIATLVSALAVAGCGGGVFLGFEFGDDDFNDHFPAVSLAADTSSAPAGAAVQLIAAASDPNGIDSVAFFRLDPIGGGATLLGADGASPYQWGTTIPVTASGSVSFFARATDGFGNQADSEVVTVTVTP